MPGNLNKASHSSQDLSAHTYPLEMYGVCVIVTDYLDVICFLARSSGLSIALQHSTCSWHHSHALTRHGAVPYDAIL